MGDTRTANMQILLHFCLLAASVYAGPIPAHIWTASTTSIPMKNAAQPGMMFPLTGLGTRGTGYQMGQKEQCWYWPSPCCTKDYCPAETSPEAFIKLAQSKGIVPRIDSGYPFGDNIHGGCPHLMDQVEKYGFENVTGRLGTDGSGGLGGNGHKACNTMGIGKGIKASGVDRKDIFITVKAGYAGPMGGTDSQIKSIIGHMQIGYADLCMMHLPEIGPGTGSHGQYGDDQCALVGKKSDKKPYNAAHCRVNTWRNMLDSMKKGYCKAIGVNNWNASDIKEIEAAGLELPSVVQYKFHLHQSTANEDQKELMEYCKQKGIIFNGFSTLGTPDWVTFTDQGMTSTALAEPKLQAIATKVGKSPAQVIQRWAIQQGVAIQTRSIQQSHMTENLDVFDWSLADEDMNTLSNMPQCHTQRGNPYMDGDPNGGSRHGNVMGLTQHC